MARSKKTPVRKRTVKKQSAFRKKSRFLLPWPYVVFIFLCIGVLLTGWTFQASADDIAVKAKVSAPLPSGPATIVSPGDGTHFTDIPITVSGTCPSDTYIEIYDNNSFAGTVLCTTDGNFQLDTSLFPGTNQLEAHVFNITDDEGPRSAPITVYYDVAEQVPPSGGESGGSNSSASSSGSSSASTGSTALPFKISSDFKYQGFSVGESVQWNLDLQGGTPPYGINVDWGDGTNSVYSKKSAGTLGVTHKYKSAGTGKNHSFVIKISASDYLSNKSSLQLFVVINPSKLPSIVAGVLPSKPHISNNWLIVAWPAYGVMVLMATSFWLGEHEEIIKLKNRRVLRGRRT